jgi:ATP-dependent Clp protease ATP-binding subunit ClpC
MFERFTDNARRAVSFAKNEAADVGATEIESQHLLMGIITADRRNIESLIGKSFVDLIQEQVLLKNRKTASTATGEIPLSSEGKRILSGARDQADSLGSSTIGSEHLLLGVLTEPKSRGGKILKQHGLDLGQLRQKLGGKDEAPTSKGFMGKLKKSFGL